MSDRTHLKVMALDDEPFMLNVLKRTLERLGYLRVSTYEDPHRALAEMDDPNGLPDLILLDLNMPKMDGVEFLRKLVERRYGGALILVSGEDESILQSVERLVQAHRIAALGHLHKPVQPQLLATLLERWNPVIGEKRGEPRIMFGAEDVRAAINNGELVNYYQPAVTVGSGELVGVEALVRWRHPIAGLVFPDQFIGVAESHGLICDVTRTVLAAALVQAGAWQDAGLELHVSVNISTEDLAALDFPDVVAAYASDTGVSPAHLVLEVTESRLMARSVIALDVLNRLRLKRFRLSIDDFGTGHSSLAQLRDVPFDELKMDRSFVHGAALDPKLLAIYRTGLELGKQLNMAVVAEGVEDRADWELLRDTGCDLAQGYFIGKPMPAADLGAWLAEWKRRVLSEALLGG